MRVRGIYLVWYRSLRSGKACHDGVALYGDGEFFRSLY